MLVLSLVAVLVVAALAAGLLQVSSAVIRHESESVDRKRAFYLAEAGLAESFSGVMFGKSGNVGSMAEPAGYGEGLFWVEASSIGSDMVELQSTGMCGSGHVTLALVVERGAIGVASLGVFSASDLIVPEGTLVDSYDSSDGEYGSLGNGNGKANGNGNGNGNGNPNAPGQEKKKAARVGSNGTIVVHSSALSPTEIHGDVVCGPLESVTVDGDPLITGDVKQGFGIKLPDVDVPKIKLEDGIVHDNGMPLLIRSGKFGYRSIAVRADSDLILQGPLTLVLEELTVDSGGSLQFDTSEGEVKLYVEKALTLSSGSLVSSTTTDPSQVYLYVSDACDASLNAKGKFYGQVFGPKAWFSLGSSFELFGAIVANGLSLAPGTKLHFDQFLAMLADEVATPRFVTWRIVDFAGPGSLLRGHDPFKALGVNRHMLRKPADAHEDQWLDITYFDKLGALRTYSGMESLFDWTDVVTIVGGWRGGGFASLTGTSGTMLVK